MIIVDEDRAVRKLSQIGYYRLSGFWYPCRRPLFAENGKFLKDHTTNLPVRDDKFQEGVNFNDITDIYLFDKQLRQLLLDAIERVEIYFRSIIAHELGRLDPLAYKSDCYINPNVMEEKTREDGSKYSIWGDWKKRQCELVAASKEDCIKWHQKREKEIPFWVVIECWDFGLMSKYFENLKRSYQDLICNKIGISNVKTLKNWMVEINTVRNKCAHHSRLWNYTMSNSISLKGTSEIEYFQNINLDQRACKKIYSHICILWYLVRKIGPSSTWIEKVADLIDSKPKIDSCPFTAMGFPDNTGFPREKFSLPPKSEPC